MKTPRFSPSVTQMTHVLVRNMTSQTAARRNWPPQIPLFVMDLGSD